MPSPKSFILLVSLFTLSTGAYADKLDKDGILRNDIGIIQYMTQTEALNACPAGTHLSTIRELAGMSQSMGAKGILETSEVKDGNVPDGYYLVYGKNPDGGYDKFYFNNNGYKRPEGYFGPVRIWSSSDYLYSGLHAYALNLLNGYVVYRYIYSRDDHAAAVRCVVDR